MNFIFDESYYKAVIFDFDGTLYDFRYLPFWLFIHAPLKFLEIKAERNVYHSMKGCDYGNKNLFESAFYAKLGQEMKVTPEKARNWYELFYMKHMIHVLNIHYKARKGVKKILDFLLKKNIKVAVFSDYPFVLERLKSIGLNGDEFNLICSSAEWGGSKPAPRLFQKVVENLGVDTSQCLMVGDREDTDGVGARSIGMDFVQIRNRKFFKIDECQLDHPLLTWEKFLDSFNF